MRAVVAIFFCLAAVFLFILSIRAEIIDDTEPKPHLVHKAPHGGTPPRRRVS